MAWHNRRQAKIRNIRAKLREKKDKLLSSLKAQLTCIFRLCAPLSPRGKYKALRAISQEFSRSTTACLHAHTVSMRLFPQAAGAVHWKQWAESAAGAPPPKPIPPTPPTPMSAPGAASDFHASLHRTLLSELKYALFYCIAI